MSIQELNTLDLICELERSKLPTLLEMSVQNTRLVGYLLTGNRTNFPNVKSSTAWLYDCPQFLYVYEADKCFDCIPIYYKYTVMYFDPKTRQTNNYTNALSSDKNPQKVIVLYLDTDEHFVLTPEPVLRATQLLF